MSSYFGWTEILAETENWNQTKTETETHTETEILAKTETENFRSLIVYTISFCIVSLPKIIPVEGYFSRSKNNSPDKLPLTSSQLMCPMPSIDYPGTQLFEGFFSNQIPG